MALDVISTLQLTSILNWNVSKNRTGLQPVNNTENLSERVNLTLGTGALQVDNLISLIQTVTASSTATLTLTGTLANVVNDLAITVARVKFIFVKLLTASDTDQNGNVIGTTCSGITMGNASVHAWPFLSSGASTVTINNGDFYVQTRQDVTGLVVGVGATDQLKFANNDALVDAKVLLAFGVCAS